MILTVTLCTAAAAALLNLWLASRVGAVRKEAGVAHGDGGHPLLVRRMRAQLNFAENVPLALILIAGIELSGAGTPWLAYVAGIFILGRLAHAMGMEHEKVGKARIVGTFITMLTLLGLAIAAVLAATGVI